MNRDKNYLRQDNHPPLATSKYGWRYHHLGIPTKVVREGEVYFEKFKMYVSAFEHSPCGIQWMRFENDSPISELVQTIPHLAFEVDNLEQALIGKEVLTGINSPSDGVRVAMINDSGAPVELIEFS